MTDLIQPPWLAEAWSHLGVMEGAGARNNARVVAFYRDAGHPEISSDSVAWCAAFVGACLKRSGLQPTGSLMARSYLAWGDTIDTPRLGAIAVFPRGADPAQGHVGFVVGMTASDVLILGGNQSDAVSVAAFARDRLLSLRWPTGDDDATPLSPAPDHEAPAPPQGYAEALDHVFDMEGGYSDDPHDPGGPTNLGITLATYAAWRRVDVSPATFAALKAELRALDRSTAGTIYRARYWNPCSAADLPPPLALIHFDAAVNHGVAAAIRMLQQACDVTIDGEVGPETLGAANERPLVNLISTYANLRIARYRALPHFWRFGRGWLNRVAKTRTAALALLKKLPPAPSKDHDMTTTSTPAEPTPKWWGNSVSIWGTIITTLSTVLPAIGPLLGFDLTGQMIMDLGNSVTTLLQAIGGVVGTILAIYGRARATQPLMRRPVALRL